SFSRDWSSDVCSSDLPLYPLAWGGVDLSDYDLVLSNKSGFCHGVQTGDALHICYCLAPTRYLWQFEHYIAREGISPAIAAALKPDRKSGVEGRGAGVR